MALIEITTDELPWEVVSQLMAREKVYYFSYLTLADIQKQASAEGCSGTENKQTSFQGCNNKQTQPTFGGGCSSPPKKTKQTAQISFWIALTDRRVLYKTIDSFMDGNEYSSSYMSTAVKDGDIPLDKISFIEVAEISSRGIGGQSTAFFLKISSSGGTTKVLIPTKEKGYDIRRVYSELTHK